MRPALKLTKSAENQRLRVAVHGAVQGVGFRPFVYRLARELDLTGLVNNSSQGVFLEVEGKLQDLKAFLLRLQRENPPRSFIRGLESSFLPAVGFTKFQILPSDQNGVKTTIVLPDIATCDDCLAEVFDPENRRYLYPFTNCTNCGPRYSIIEALPYDRPNTTMKRFAMCRDCLAEYHDPLDRRFHAQPNACPVCGPSLSYWHPSGTTLATGHEALRSAADAIRNGRIVAVKGLGGFHLMVDALNDEAVQSLRRRKHREEKPLALMLPSIQSVETICELSDLEKRILGSPERPIVILKAKETIHSIASNVAPANPHLACMLPYTPLHHLLMNDLGFPVVATSGNVSDEPICTDESDALTRLGGIADAFLVHNRPIVRHVDDSIVRIMAGRETVLRRARGLAPLPFQRKQSDKAVLAVGAHLKNTIAASAGDQTFLSQHIGDLETPQAIAAFKRVIESVDDLYAIEPKFIACDTHPDYTSTRFAKSLELQTLGVQHHFAHVLSCMAENDLEPPVLGITWDGTGFGDDGTIWGGEFLEIGSDDFERVAHYRTFPLPGGEKAVRQPRRAGLGVLYEAFGDDAFEMSELKTVRSFDASELEVLKHMLSKGLNCPLTSSVGRLFDAVASIVGLRQYAHFEGQAAMQLEFAIGRVCDGRWYNFELTMEPGNPLVVDWTPVIVQIIADVNSKIDTSLIAVRFHNTLVETMVCISKKIGVPAVALSGGCFQNKYLLERAVRRLEEEGLRPYWHQRVPTNDGGIALGQTLAMDRFISSKGMRGSVT